MFIDLEQIKDFAENPITTVVAASSTTGLALISKYFPESLFVHEILTDVSLLCGIIVCITLARLHWVRGNREKKEFDMEYQDWLETHKNKDHDTK